MYGTSKAADDLPNSSRMSSDWKQAGVRVVWLQWRRERARERHKLKVHKLCVYLYLYDAIRLYIWRYKCTHIISVLRARVDRFPMSNVEIHAGLHAAIRAITCGLRSRRCFSFLSFMK